MGCVDRGGKLDCRRTRGQEFRKFLPLREFARNFIEPDLDRLIDGGANRLTSTGIIHSHQTSINACASGVTKKASQSNKSYFFFFEQRNEILLSYYRHEAGRCEIILSWNKDLIMEEQLITKRGNDGVAPFEIPVEMLPIDVKGCREIASQNFHRAAPRILTATS